MHVCMNVYTRAFTRNSFTRNSALLFGKGSLIYYMYTCIFVLLLKGCVIRPDDTKSWRACTCNTYESEINLPMTESRVFRVGCGASEPNT